MGTKAAINLLAKHSDQLRMHLHAEGGVVSLVITPTDPDLAMLAYQVHFIGRATKPCRCGPDGRSDGACLGKCGGVAA
jgi:hypothetical protein